MSELGASVFRAFNFLAEFFRDVSRLVSVVEERMAGDDLVSLWGNQAMWGRSSTYYIPAKWVPTHVVRQYVEEPADGSKPDRESPWFVFFNVYFAPERFGEPIAVWGVAMQSGGKDLWQPFDTLTISQDGPDFLDEIPVDEWRSVEDLPKALSSFKYRARRVVELKDAEIVDELVVRPLLQEVRKLRESSG
jgi:hypothetical protein